jgi:hypothetical protein
MSEYRDDSGRYKFSRPAEHIKALNVEPIPQNIFDNMSKYNDTARGMSIYHSLLAPGENTIFYGTHVVQDSPSMDSSLPRRMNRAALS